MSKYIVGNWKMNQTLPEIKAYFEYVEKYSAKFNCESWIAPQAIHLAPLMNKSKKIVLGAQNSAPFDKGAYTGEVSPVALKELGAKFTIVGHSERRTYFKEHHALLNKKTEAALNAGLKVIFCVGETAQERNDDRTFVVIEEQLREGLKSIIIPNPEALLVAYEPIWAIGTGMNATASQAQEVHEFIRVQLKDTFPTTGKDLPILYGGSVNTENIESLLAQRDIDGALVGGASLKPEDYTKLCLLASKF
ncbi:MAG: triose-phosphate isomerase [Bacteriovoracaceae bacterium]|nr:triose-phosphate isomerase [Bacteriovoracaceae bacterium]